MSESTRLQPVQDYVQPDYPTRQQYESSGEPLEHNWPEAWKYGKGFLKGLVVAAGLNIAGCSSDSVNWNVVPTTAASAYDASADPFADDAQFPHPLVLQAADWTREIYDNGQWAMLGCVAIMPPSFIPEDEAALGIDVSE